MLGDDEVGGEQEVIHAGKLHLHFFQIMFTVFRHLLYSTNPGHLCSCFSALRLCGGHHILNGFFFNFFTLLFYTQHTLTYSTQFLQTTTDNYGTHQTDQDNPTTDRGDPYSDTYETNHEDHSTPGTREGTLPNVCRHDAPPILETTT